MREKAKRQRELQENMARIGGVEGELERLTRQRKSMMGEFEDVLGEAEMELEEERRRSLSAEEIAEEELQSSMAQLGGTHEEELERLKDSYNRRRRSMMVEYEDALGAAEVLTERVAELTERVAELELEISAMRDISAARDAAAQDGSSAMQTAMDVLSGKLQASDVHKDRLATRSQQKRFLTRVLLEWRRATRHDKLAREIDTTKAQQEALKERRALEKCLTTGSRRAFFGWKALREQALLERRAEQQQAEKVAQEEESAAAVGEVEGELERLRKMRRSMMIEYEEALEEADTLNAKTDMLGAKVESQEAKAMKQKEARAPTPDPNPNPNPDPGPNPNSPDSNPNPNPNPPTPTLRPQPSPQPSPQAGHPAPHDARQGASLPRGLPQVVAAAMHADDGVAGGEGRARAGAARGADLQGRGGAARREAPVGGAARGAGAHRTRHKHRTRLHAPARACTHIKAPVRTCTHRAPCCALRALLPPPHPCAPPMLLCRRASPSSSTRCGTASSRGETARGTPSCMPRSAGARMPQSCQAHTSPGSASGNEPAASACRAFHARTPDRTRTPDPKPLRPPRAGW